MRGFGVLFLILGLLAVIVGLGVAGYGYFDQQQHERDSGPFGVGEDRDRSSLNDGLMAGGGVTGVLGLVFVFIGIILLVSGRDTTTRDTTARDTTARGGAATHAAATTGSAGTTGSAAMGSVTTTAGMPTTDRPEGKGKAGSRAAAAVGLAAIAVVGAFALVLAVSSGGGLGASDASVDSNRVLLDESREGSVPAGLTVAGSSQLVEESRVAFQAPAGTKRVEAVFEWTPGLTGADAFQVYLEIETPEGWLEVAQATGGPGLAVAAEDVGFGNAAMRLRVFPAEDGVTQQQDYGVHIVAMG